MIRLTVIILFSFLFSPRISWASEVLEKATIAAESGNYEKAFRLLKSIPSNELDISEKLLMGISAYETGRLTEAKSIFNQSLVEAENFRNAYATMLFYLARVSNGLSQHDDAAQFALRYLEFGVFQNLQTIEEAVHFVLLYDIELSKSNESLQRRQERLLLCQRILESGKNSVNGKSDFYHNTMGRLYFALGDVTSGLFWEPTRFSKYERSLAEFELAVRRLQMNARVWANLAVAQFRLAETHYAVGHYNYLSKKDIAENRPGRRDLDVALKNFERAVKYSSEAKDSIKKSESLGGEFKSNKSLKKVIDANLSQFLNSRDGVLASMKNP